jgi:hypothetical protein
MALEIRVLLHTVLNYFNLQSVASNFQVSFHPMLFLITHIMIFILLTYAISKELLTLSVVSILVVLLHHSSSVATFSLCFQRLFPGLASKGDGFLIEV